MIVPRNRLILLSSVVLLPSSLAGTFFHTAAAPTASVVIFYLLIIVIDAISASHSLRGIQVRMPELIRLSRDREGSIELNITNESAWTRRIRIGLPLPAGLFIGPEDFVASLPQSAQNSLVTLPFTPKKRGRYSINACYIEGNSALGLWAMRSAVSVRSEIRVYPGLPQEQNDLAAIFLNRGLPGVHSHRQVGQGREFEKLREYVYGDSYDGIHWKTTAKRGRPITKVFQVERTQDVYIVIDSSRLSARSVMTGPETGDDNGHPTEEILDRFITAALVMGIAAERQGDRFGFIGFSKAINIFMRAKSGRTHYNACRDLLYNMMPDRVNPDIDETCSFICNRLRKRSLIIFLTNLDDPVIAESFDRNMEMVRKKHLVLVTMLKPQYVHPLFSGQKPLTTDDIYVRLGGHIAWQGIRELSKRLTQRGIGFSLMESERLCSQLVSQYLTIKKRQLL